MATAAEVKAAYGVNAKGRPGKHIIDSWNAEHPDDPYSTGADGNGHAPDYPNGADDFEGLFPGPSGGGGVPDGDDVPPETPPRRPKAPPRRSRSWASPFKRGGASKGKRKAKPRVSTEDLLGGLWRAGAKLAAPLPPLQRTLRVQAPVAGVLLEDVVKDTVIDPLLQPFARLAAAGQTFNALLGPPVWVTAISVHAVQRAAMQPPQEPHPLFMAVASEGLRSGLMAWCEVSGPAFEKAMQRERDFEEKYGQKVDDMMEFLLLGIQVPAGTSEEAAVQAEEDAIRRAQGIL